MSLRQSYGLLKRGQLLFIRIKKFWKLNVKSFGKKFLHRLLYIESDFWIISSKKFLKCSFVYLPACPLLILDPKLTQTRHFSDYCLI